MTRRTDLRPPRQLAQTTGARPPSATVTCRRCGAFYVDDPEGSEAHRVVFGHPPTDRNDP